MPALPQSSVRRRPWRSCLFALFAFWLLTSCANGDFGEVRPVLASDDIHDWIGFDAAASQHQWPSSFELTDDERLLRDFAYPLIEPPYDRQQWYSVLGEYGLIDYVHGGPFDRTLYAQRLMSSYARSPLSRYATLSDDIRNDSTRIPPFFETAWRVLDLDQKRRKSLAYVSELTRSEKANALRRIRENAVIIAMVNEKLAQRASSYGYALERLVIMTPSPQAVGVEYALKQLQALIARYRKNIPPEWVRQSSLVSAR